MGILIDTSILIASERGKFDLKALVVRHLDEAFAIASIVAAELLRGVELCDPVYRDARKAATEGMLADFEVLPFDLDAARVHARLAGTLTRQGKPVGTMDLLIAAIAVRYDFRIATLDQRSFPSIPGASLLDLD